MNYWLFKVSTKKFEQGYPDEFKSLNDKPFFQTISTNAINKPKDNIGDIIFYYNVDRESTKKYPKGVYLICKIIKNLNIDNQIELKVIKDLRFNPIEPASFGFDETMQSIHSLNQNGTYYKFENNAIGKKIYELLLNENSKVLELIDIIENNNEFNTEIKRDLTTRLGQGKFREKLIGYWKGCSVTNSGMIDILVASHIKPWKNSNNQERLDVYNGLLLLPNLDKLFDKGYISFDDRGHILISSKIENREILGINNKMSIKLEKEHLKYLKYHREELFYN